MCIPEDVQDRLGRRKVRRSTNTDSEKLAQGQANNWAEDFAYEDNILCFLFTDDKGRRRKTHRAHIVPVHSKTVDIVQRPKVEAQDGFLIKIDAKSDQVEDRSTERQKMVSMTGTTSHQFRATVIAMLAQTDANESHKMAVVGHTTGSEDVHEKNYVAIRRPGTIRTTVLKIDWENWVWKRHW